MKRLLWIILLFIIFVLIFSGCGKRDTKTQIPTPTSMPFKLWEGVIAFRSENSSVLKANLWLINPDGSKLVTNNADWWGSIKWSPDGNYLAYRISFENYFRRIVVASKDGTTIHTFNSYGDEEINWSNQSDYFLCGVYYQGIFKYGIDGSMEELLFSQSETYDHNPVFSRDGLWVYFVHHSWENQCRIYRIKTEKLLQGGLHYSDCELLCSMITEGHDENVFLGPTNEGKLIISFSNVLSVMDPETKEIQDISNGGNQKYSQLKLSPNGSYLVAGTKIFDTLSWQQIAIIDSTQLYNFLHSFSYAWSPCSDALVIGGCYRDIYPTKDRYFRAFIWRLNDQRLQKIFEMKEEAITTVSKKSVAIEQVVGDTESSVDWTN